MPSWPTGNRFQPIVGTINEMPPNNKIASQMDVGPKKLRRRTTAGVRPLSFKLILTKDQMATFDNFYEGQCFSGTIPFSYLHPRTGVACEAQFKPDSIPAYTHKGGDYWEVNVELEILP